MAALFASRSAVAALRRSISAVNSWIFAVPQPEQVKQQTVTNNTQRP
jgi:hypothetical protein